MKEYCTSITDKHITADLAKEPQESDQFPAWIRYQPADSSLGSRKPVYFKEFTEYCETIGITTQSIGKAGCPCDNAPMERYYITLRMNLLITIIIILRKELYQAIREFAYVHYNHERPHSYNNYKTPFEARYEP